MVETITGMRCTMPKMDNINMHCMGEECGYMTMSWLRYLQMDETTKKILKIFNYVSSLP